MRLQVSLLSLLVLVCGGLATRADFINGDFQTGNLSGWTVFTTPNGTVGAPTVVSFDVTGSGASLAARLQVGHAVIEPTVHRGGGILQSLNLAAGAYNLTADWAAFSTTNNASGGLFSVILDGVTLASFDTGGIAASATERGSFNLNINVAAGLHEFRFQATRPFLLSNFQYWDNLHINALQAVPTPSGLVLAGIGVMGALCVRRRLRRQVV
jgi:hypothetical protein